MQSSSAQHPSSSSGKTFTESWLQALTLSVAYDSARQIRPRMTDIDLLCASTVQPGQTDAAQRIWDYCESAGLTALLHVTPYRQDKWRFEDDECFVYSHSNLASEPSFTAWVNGLGIEPGEFAMKASVLSQDWSDLLRKEAVRKGKPLNVSAIPQGNMLEMPCTLSWDNSAWTTRFAQPDWLAVTQPGPFLASRPSLEELNEIILFAIEFANTKLKTTGTHSVMPLGAPWMDSIEKLTTLHTNVVCDNTFKTSMWFRRIWSCVWPVVYRERNRLRGPCDLQWLRTELAGCFGNAPALTEWMFVFAKLLCQCQLGNGMGVSGDFVDE